MRSWCFSHKTNCWWWHNDIMRFELLNVQYNKFRSFSHKIYFNSQLWQIIWFCLQAIRYTPIEQHHLISTNIIYDISILETTQLRTCVSISIAGYSICWVTYKGPCQSIHSLYSFLANNVYSLLWTIMLIVILVIGVWKLLSNQYSFSLITH